MPLRARLKAGSLVLLVALVLAGYGGYRLAEWPGFHLQRVSVSGNLHVSSAQIVESAAIPRDRNLWLVPLGGAAARIARIPWIASVRLRRLPPATLHIDLTERTPVAVAEEPAGAFGIPAYLLVDAGGAVIERAQTPRWPLPILRGSDPRSPEFRRMVADLRTLGEAGVNVRELDLTRVGELVAITYTRLKLDLGDDADLAHKASLVNPIITRLGRRVSSVSALDLRAPGTPVIVYR